MLQNLEGRSGANSNSMANDGIPITISENSPRKDARFGISPHNEEAWLIHAPDSNARDLTMEHRIKMLNHLSKLKSKLNQPSLINWEIQNHGKQTIILL